MRRMEFTMDRDGLVKIGDQVNVIEGKLPSSYYYTIEHAIAMSGNYPNRERLKTTRGTVVDIQSSLMGKCVILEFDE
ncbi:hypothetical protein GCM10008910_21980 [Faecalicatena orotica]|uniref:Uncharacterized protein n=1 Tax=Faecalicatena orotica TaxID=1544 RepID=A0A2Y9B9T2_9FIRM|nr:hypothetical protein [Faecalicatena orotica]PWJ32427.1 hypothetical protein A8806_101716 [Faecalicatena orotica]SSA54262.1 hypothetical protein SAMN05216536_101716 [Faecalicatena orotica]